METGPNPAFKIDYEADYAKRLARQWRNGQELGDAEIVVLMEHPEAIKKVDEETGLKGVSTDAA